MGRDSLTLSDIELDTYTSYFFKNGKKRKTPKKIYRPYWSKKQWGFFVVVADKAVYLEKDMTFSEAKEKAVVCYGYSPDVVGIVLTLKVENDDDFD